jgi:hypothetical protein
LIRRISDNRDPTSLATRMRRRRFAFFRGLLDTLPRPVRILDVGGTAEFWRNMDAPLAELEITLLNPLPAPADGPFHIIQGDARDLGAYDDRSVDVVFSNSVIEHLGPHFDDQRRMATEIRRVGKRYFVQTPNRYFPLEPHFLTPGFQYLPVGARAWLVSHFSLGWYPRIADRAHALREVEQIVLLSARQVRDLFPGARIYRERVLGLTKSFVAYSGWGSI